MMLEYLNALENLKQLADYNFDDNPFINQNKLHLNQKDHDKLFELILKAKRTMNLLNNKDNIVTLIEILGVKNNE